VANVLSREEKLTILSLLVEGNSLRSISRHTKTHRTTIMNLLVEIGVKCRTFLDKRMRNLTSAHLECDEIWTFVQKKQRRLNEAEKDNPAIGDQYVFFAIDYTTKLVPCFAIGKRTKETTEIFAQDLARRLVPADLFAANDERPQVSTDGWQAYPDAIDDAFAGAVNYGQIIKDFDATEQPGRYGPPILVDTTRRVISGAISKKSICTSHVERKNLTIRTFIRRFTRLSLGFSKKLANLMAAVSLHFAYYNYCWMHGSLTGTPAMAAGIAGHPWNLEELFDAVGDFPICQRT
jgi:IS1 family transposase